MKQKHRDEHDELNRQIRALAKRVYQIEQLVWTPKHEAAQLAEAITRGNVMVAHNLGLPELSSQDLAWVRQCIIEDQDR